MRGDGQSVEDALMNNEPCEVELKEEPMGESVAVRDNNEGFVTTSEGSHASLYSYEFN